VDPPPIVIVKSARGDFAQRPEAMRCAWSRRSASGDVAPRRTGNQNRRIWELWRPPKPPCTSSKDPASWTKPRLCANRRSAAPRRAADFVAAASAASIWSDWLQNPFALAGPDAREAPEQSFQPRPPVAIVRGKVCPAEERLQIRRQPDRQRPAAATGQGLHKGHVDAIDVGPLFAVHLDADKASFRIRATSGSENDSRAITWTPVAGRIADRQEDGLVSPGAPFRRRRDPTDTSPPG